MLTPINISASRGAAILGLSQYQTPVSVWLQIMESRDPGFCEKRGYVLPEFEYNAAMRWGHAFESAIIELAERAQGEEIICREAFHDVEMPHTGGATITCHIDGEYRLSEKLHEGKTTSAQNFRESWGEPGTDRIPQEYQIQVQHQMICTGAEKVIVSVLVFPRRVEEWEEMGIVPAEYDGEWTINGDPLRWAVILAEMGYFHQYHVDSNPELQAIMLEKYAAFWNNHVLTGEPPEPQNYDDIRALCPAPVGTIIATDEIARLMAEYKNIGAEIGQSGGLYKRREQIKTAVLTYMKDAGAVTDDESGNKWILRGPDGKKLAQYNGKVFR